MDITVLYLNSSRHQLSI